MVATAFSALTTERLVLRRFRSEDLDAFVAYRSDPQIARYQVWEAPYLAGQHAIGRRAGAGGHAPRGSPAAEHLVQGRVDQ
jgi:RimJ/RimL family protein N-acetyltransferase